MTDTVVVAKNEEKTIEKSVEPTFPRRTIAPRVDIYETSDSIVVVANMPGVSEGDINVTLEEDQLTIDGEVFVESMDGYKQVYGEQCIRNYRRRFTLSDKVDREAIEATLKNGVLTLTLSKMPAAKARQITVQASS
jgi:HSP20 family protein